MVTDYSIQGSLVEFFFVMVQIQMYMFLINWRASLSVASTFSMDDVDCPSQQNDEVSAEVQGDYVIEEEYYRLERKTQRFVRRGG
jgi:hypothetical protein